MYEFCRGRPGGETNLEWNPKRSFYGRLVGMSDPASFNGGNPISGAPLFAEESRSVNFVNTIVYDRDLPLGRIQRIMVSGFEKVLRKLEDDDIPPVVYSTETYVEFLYWFITREILAPGLEGITPGAIKAHSPYYWALATRPDAVWTWTIASFLSDEIEPSDSPSDNPSDPGDGGGGGGLGDGGNILDEDFPEAPRDPNAEFELDFPPPGSPTSFFEQEPSLDLSISVRVQVRYSTENGVVETDDVYGFTLVAEYDSCGFEANNVPGGGSVGDTLFVNDLVVLDVNGSRYVEARVSAISDNFGSVSSITCSLV